jgi:hypothetical protein
MIRVDAMQKLLSGRGGIFYQVSLVAGFYCKKKGFSYNDPCHPDTSQ